MYTASVLMGSGPSVYPQEKDVSRMTPSELEDLLSTNDFEFILQKFHEFGECFILFAAPTCNCSIFFFFCANRIKTLTELMKLLRYKFKIITSE